MRGGRADSISKRLEFEWETGGHPIGNLNARVRKYEFIPSTCLSEGQMGNAGVLMRLVMIEAIVSR